MVEMSPKDTNTAPLPDGSQRIAAILDEPQVVFLRKSGDRVGIEDVAQCVSNEHRPSFLAARRFELAWSISCGHRHVHENRYQAILNDGIDHVGNPRRQ